MRASAMLCARAALLLTGAVVLGGCSFFSTTTDGVKSTVGTITDFTSSTTPSKSSKSAFISNRFEAIRFEAAKGEGENVDALAALLGEPDRRAFGQWLKSNYALLFTDLRTPEELLGRIEQRRHAAG